MKIHEEGNHQYEELDKSLVKQHWVTKSINTGKPMV